MGDFPTSQDVTSAIGDDAAAWNTPDLSDSFASAAATAGGGVTDPAAGPTDMSLPDALACVVFSLTFFSGFFLNVALVVAFARRRGFRSHVSNRFLLNLAFSNLFSVAATTPLLLLTHSPASSHSASLRHDLTAFLDALLTSSASASTAAQLLVGADQYLAVTDPLMYSSRISKTRCLLVCLGAWTFSLFMGALVALDEMGVVGAEDSLSLIVSSAMFFLLFVVPFVVLAFIYVRVFVAAHGNSIRTRKNSISSSIGEHAGGPFSRPATPGGSGKATPCNFAFGSGSGNVPNRGASHAHQFNRHAHNVRLTPYHQVNRDHGYHRSVSSRSFSSGQPGGGMRQRLSFVAQASAEAIFRGEEARAARVAAVVIAGLATCWAPYFTVTLICTSGASVEVPAWARTASLALASLSPTLTPLLYAYRSRRVLRDIKWAFGMRDNTWSDALKRQRRVLASTGIHSSPARFVAREEEDKGSGVRRIVFFRGSDQDQSHGQVRRAKSLSCPHLLPSPLPGERKAVTAAVVSDAAAVGGDGRERKFGCVELNRLHPTAELVRCSVVTAAAAAAATELCPMLGSERKASVSTASASTSTFSASSVSSSEATSVTILME